MKTVCNSNKCSGCMVCIEKCTKNAIIVEDGLNAYNGIIDENRCVNCGMCKSVCPNINLVEKRKPTEWYEGWADNEIRMASSSGGAAADIIRNFIKNGGYVAACLFEKGEFIFRLTNDLVEAKKFAGSKYVKSNPKGIYRKIEKRLEAGDKVLFVGLPCQVAAINNFIKKKDQLYTIDLICLGTPSPKILEKFLREKEINIKKINTIKFREKTSYGIQINNRRIAPIGMKDMYTYAFVMNTYYTENCYSCRYADLERVSDLTLGDSWASNLDKDEKAKGISLILCQSQKGQRLLQESALKLKEVNLEESIKRNYQLKQPPQMPEKRDIFFANIEDGFHKAMAKSYPKFYYKKLIKSVFVKWKLLKGNEN